MLRVIVVDDEPPARRLLSRMCSAHEGVEVVGTGASLAEAAELVSRLSPAAAFLDIDLGEGGADGFSLLRDMNRSFDAVFVTAHAGHALRAFDHGAVDYLLKPVDPDRLADALGRLRGRRQESLADARQPESRDRRIAIRIDGALEYLAPAEFAILQAEGDYTRALLLSGRALLIGKRLGQLEEDCSGSALMRVSRSIILNPAAILTIRMIAGGKQALTLRGVSEPVVVGRSGAQRLRSWSRRGEKPAGQVFDPGL